MVSAQSNPRRRSTLARLACLAGWLAVGFGLLLALGWGCLALWLDGPGAPAAIAFVLLSIALPVFVRPRRRGWIGSAIVFVLVLGWWLSIKPSNERDWLPEVARLPSAKLEGERLTVVNVRNFEYRSETDFTPRWEVRSYDLERLVSADLIVCDWGAPMIVHTILSFEFEGGEYLSVSIETRKEQGEGYSALRGFFRQFELYYVVGDERDLLGVRVGPRGEHVRVHRLGVSAEQARSVLLAYVRRINELVREPTWYNALTQNCTTSIRLHANDLQIERPWDWRILINGKGEELLHSRGMVNNTLPFEELRARSDVTESARAALGSPGFSTAIRRNLPARPEPR
jgi:hypothetical protein